MTLEAPARPGLFRFPLPLAAMHPGVMNPAVKYREVRRRLREEGFIMVAVRGSHEQWVHTARRGKVTVAGADNDDVRIGTLRGIYRQAGWVWRKGSR
jgi:predicted RNA binding protein YcfA (HicA-like mRNA interferase family)